MAIMETVEEVISSRSSNGQVKAYKNVSIYFCFFSNKTDSKQMNLCSEVYLLIYAGTYTTIRPKKSKDLF